MTMLPLRFSGPASNPPAPPAPPAKPETVIDLAARRRAIRVYALTAAIVVMSLADLSMTLTYLKTVGMGEANPIARYVIGFNSPVLLGVWKCATVGLACMIFIMARHRRSGEAACWVCAGILMALSIGWISYSNEAHRLTSTLDTVTQMDSALWVSMSGNPQATAAHE